MEEIFREYAGMVYGVCQRILRDPDLSEDATQAVFLILWRKRNEIRTSPKIAGWLHRTATLVANQAVRSRTRRRKHEARAATAVDTRGHEHSLEEIGPHLDEAIGRLSRVQRETVVLRFLFGLRPAEVAERMDCPVRTVDTRITHALRKLRATLSRSLSGLTLTALTATLTRSVEAAPRHLIPSLQSAITAGTGTPGAQLLMEDSMRSIFLKAARQVAAALILIASIGLTLPTLLAKDESPSKGWFGADDPLSPPKGRRWIYQETHREIGLSGKEVTYRQDLIIESGETRKTDLGDLTEWQVRFDRNRLVQLIYRQEKDGIYLVERKQRAGKVQHKNAGLSQKELFLKTPLRPGQTWKFGNLSAKSKDGGSIHVPAGTFQTVRIDWKRGEGREKAPELGLWTDWTEPRGAMTLTSVSIWMAREIGVVREIRTYRQKNQERPVTLERQLTKIDSSLGESVEVETISPFELLKPGPQARLFRTQKEWVAAFPKKANLESIDFSKKQLLLLDWGTKGSGGYGMAVAGANKTNGGIRIRVMTGGQNPNNVITRPVLAVLLPRSEKVEVKILGYGRFAERAADRILSRMGDRLVVIGANPSAGKTELQQNPEGNFDLDISNQSLTTPKIQLKVWIDDKIAVDEAFFTGDQHMSETFRFSLSAGKHRIRVGAGGKDPTFSSTITVENKHQWAYLSHSDKIDFTVTDKQRPED